MNEELVQMADVIQEFLEIKGLFEDDKYINEALDDLIKLSIRKDIPDAVVRSLIVKLQSIGSVCALRATMYTHIKKGKAGSIEYQRKQFLYTLSSEIDKVVAALKYMART